MPSVSKTPSTLRIARLSTSGPPELRCRVPLDSRRPAQLDPRPAPSDHSPRGWSRRFYRLPTTVYRLLFYRLPSAPIDADLLRVPVGPGAMHVARYGHGGRPILLIHGLGTSSFLWREVAPSLALANHTALAVDLFGHGESDRPYDGDFGIAAQADYVDRAFTALRVTRAVVVGCDLGAAVAMRLAAAHPDRVDSIVLVSPPDIDELPGEDVKLLQRSVRMSPLLQHRGVMGAAPLLRPVLEASVADPEAMPDRLVARYLAPFVGKDGVSQLLTLARSVRAQDLHEDELRAIRAPAMIVVGEKDRWLSIRAAERLAGMLPESRLERIEGAGRLIPEEEPDRLAELLLSFVGSV